MAKISPIILKIGVPIDIGLNDAQNKNLTHNFKDAAKISNTWFKEGQLQLGHKDFKWA